MLGGIISERKRQFDLYSDMNAIDKKEKMINAIDDINGAYGKETIHSGAFSHRKAWGMRQELKSPNYTTRWEDLPVIRI
jgi:DNA polymerase V